MKPQMTITAKNLEELRALLDAWNIDHYRVRVEGTPLQQMTIAEVTSAVEEARIEYSEIRK